MKKRVLAALLVTMMTVAMPNLMIQIKKQVQSLRVMTKKIPERK